MPQCGFSRASIQILSLQGVDPSKFAAFNVLEDQGLREGKCFLFNYPTSYIPRTAPRYKWRGDGKIREGHRAKANNSLRYQGVL